MRRNKSCPLYYGYLRFVMSALSPKADMCGALAHVRFGLPLGSKTSSRWPRKRSLKCDARSALGDAEGGAEAVHAQI
jgi:hypothetical protein